ncbi:glutaminyl-peptide cyclotransferase [Oceaniferula spumae]|uniref:Glutaminyl-peptide cyclotransferase n=1 Tax=Oceaniferula spumae TaxID=2979115 RepID=A0AAT9FIK7_9BACT
MKLLLGWLVLSVAACKDKPEATSTPPSEPAVAVQDGQAPEWKSHQWSKYEVVRELPHDTAAYTQGLLLSDGHWMESTGGFGASSIRRVEKATGKVLKLELLGKNFFGEGLTQFGDKFYQLTWQSHQGFVYDAKSLKRLSKFNYQGEGWGLTTDGKSLIMSDGSDRLRFLDPKTFKVTREIFVSYRGKSVIRLNELEFVEGEIFANVWHTEQIVRINPVDGNVVGVIELTGIYPDAGKKHPEYVLNGIAYDAESKELYVTGKCWPKIYQIRLVKVR